MERAYGEDKTLGSGCHFVHFIERILDVRSTPTGFSIPCQLSWVPHYHKAVDCMGKILGLATRMVGGKQGVSYLQGLQDLSLLDGIHTRQRGLNTKG